MGTSSGYSPGGRGATIDVKRAWTLIEKCELRALHIQRDQFGFGSSFT